VSSSPHKLTLGAPLRDVALKNGAEKLVSENRMRQMLEERFRAGYEAGEKALGEQLVEQRKQVIELQNGVLRSLAEALPQVIAESEKSIVLLALEAARQVVHEIPVDAAFVERVVQRALRELKDTAEYEVVLHPSDLELLQKIGSGLLPKTDSGHVRFSPDPRIASGDCLVHTRHGSIAAVREQMLDKLEASVVC
jgi:flagellar biosynthesis/type III secretory pathway protein FliH